MAEFGWAYVAGGAITGALGPTGSVLLKKGDTQISGSPNLTFDTSTNQLELTGALSASSAITASSMNLYGLSAGTPPNTSSYLAVDSNYNLVLTSAAGGSGGGSVRSSTGKTSSSSVRRYISRYGRKAAEKRFGNMSLGPRHLQRARCRSRASGCWW